MLGAAALRLQRVNWRRIEREPGLVDTPMTRNPGRWNEALKEAGKQPEGDNPKEEDVIAARLPTSEMKIPWMQPSDVAPVAVAT